MRHTQSWKPLLLVGALFGFGCSNAVTIPADRVASPEASIRAAQEVGAQGTPRASLHLQFAQDQLNQAKKLMQEGEGERANLLLQRAQADAELALTLTREAQAKGMAQQMIEQVEQLRKQGPGAQ